MADNRGLYDKYKILDGETGEEKQGTYFVLKPDTDPAAIAALQKYAEITTNEELAEHISCWIDGLKLTGVEQPPECDYCDEIVSKVRASPFLADGSAKMCKVCWDNTKKEYANSHDEYIPDFEGYSHFNK